VQGFLRELQAPVVAAFLVVGVAAVVGGAISCWCKLDKLESHTEAMQKSIADLDTKVAKSIADLDTKVAKSIADLDAKVESLATEMEEFGSLVHSKVDQFLRQSGSDRWYNLCLVGLGGTVVYMAAKPR
jgi:hypothetical protein